MDDGKVQVTLCMLCQAEPAFMIPAAKDCDLNAYYCNDCLPAIRAAERWLFVARRWGIRRPTETK